MKFFLASVAVIILLVTPLFIASAQTDTPLPDPTVAPTPEPPSAPPSPGDDDALQSGLLWLFGGGGAGLAAYALLGKIKAFEGLTPEHKRYASLAVTAALAVLAYLAASSLNYVEAPVTAQGWLEKLSAIAYASTATALVLHGYKQLRDRKSVTGPSIEPGDHNYHGNNAG